MYRAALDTDTVTSNATLSYGIARRYVTSPKFNVEVLMSLFHWTLLLVLLSLLLMVCALY